MADSYSLFNRIDLDSYFVCSKKCLKDTGFKGVKQVLYKYIKKDPPNRGSIMKYFMRLSLNDLSE